MTTKLKTKRSKVEKMLALKRGIEVDETRIDAVEAFEQGRAAAMKARSASTASNFEDALAHAKEAVAALEKFLIGELIEELPTIECESAKAAE